MLQVLLPLVLRIEAHIAAGALAKHFQEPADSLSQEYSLPRVRAPHDEDGPLPQLTQRRVQQGPAAPPAQARQLIAAKQRWQFDVSINVAAGVVKNPVEVWFQIPVFSAATADVHRKTAIAAIVIWTFISDFAPCRPASRRPPS